MEKEEGEATVGYPETAPDRISVRPRHLNPSIFDIASVGK